jgi:hypothetical protein
MVSGNMPMQWQIAMVTRRLMTEIMLGKYDYDRKTFRKMNKTEIIDLGGIYVNYARDRCLDIHCCTPTINIRDSARENERGCEMDKMVKGKNGRKKISSTLRNRYMYPERSLTKRQLNVRCKKLCQDCDVQAEIGIAVHSTYDMRITQLLAAWIGTVSKDLVF